MNAISPWVAAVKDIFNEQDLPAIFTNNLDGYEVKVHSISNSLWIAITCPKGSRVILRAAYAPNDHLQLTMKKVQADGILIHLKASLGTFKVKVELPGETQPLLRYTTTLTPSEPLIIPFWPRDMIILGREGQKPAKGKINIKQEGTRTGLQYICMDKPASGALLYMQNLTALNDYCQATETALSNVVGGTWPELGFALPSAMEKPLPSGKEFVIADAFLAFDPKIPKDEMEAAKQFMNLLADIYLYLPKPATTYHNWPDILDKGLADLENNGCWSHAAGQDYLNAYVCDYETPPESMVQLAVLLPLLEYNNWSKRDLPVIKKIKQAFPAFYDEKLKTVVRWLPSRADKLDQSEEQLKPNVMDSWYLHHPLLHLSQMAIKGDKDAEKLFLNSLAFTIKVAHHFNYEWPVFYNMETLEVIKAETVPGKGGEKDVAGLYAHVMMQAWELTKENKFLQEAKRAAKTLQGKGFDIFYQANNTAFAANAMLRLYKETKEQVYLDLCYLCLANIIKNFQVWECDYGYAKYYSTFFAMFPLNDAPYTAAYEEQEVFSAMHTLLIDAEGIDILPSVSMLLAEFIRYIVQRAGYYYPPNLPKEMLSDEVKMGQVDAKLWIAIEDIHDGWEKSGAVGQEVYGAGVAFGIVPRHFYQVPGEPFMIYADYPTDNFSHRKTTVSFNVKGDKRLTGRLMVVKTGKAKLPQFMVTGMHDKQKPLKGKQRRDGHLEYEIAGSQQVKISW